MRSLFQVFGSLVLVLSLTCFVEARGRRGYSSSGGTTSASQAIPLEKFEGPVLPIEEALLERVNQHRIVNGLKVLVLDPVLKLRARRHCEWMTRNGMVHSNEGAENIAAYYSTVESVMQGWMNSSGHRSNILNPGWTRAGMVGYVGSNGVVYWCQQFSN